MRTRFRRTIQASAALIDKYEWASARHHAREKRRLEQERDGLKLTVGIARKAGWLSLIAFCFAGCVVVNPPNEPRVPTQTVRWPLGATNLRSSPVSSPPMPPTIVSRRIIPPTSFTAKFTCINVALSMANREVRDERGIGTGQWEAERRYVVTLQPVPEGTNGITLWGANRDGMIKIITTSDEFQQGKTYEIVNAP